MKILDSVSEIEKTLYEFDDVFPLHKEKVSDYSKWAEKLFNNGVVACLYVNDIKVGIVAFYSNNTETHIGYISLIGVKNAYCGRGFGKKLIDYATYYMKSYSMSKAMLEVEKNNYPAQKFYRSNGFEIEKESANTYYMSKSL